MRERENWQCMCSGFELRHMNRRKQMIKKRRAAAAAATKENGKETRREFVYNCAAAFCNYPKEESKKEDPKELCGPRARYWKPKRRRNKKKKRRKQRRHQRLVWGKVDRPKKTKRAKYRTMRGKSIIGTAADEFIRCAPSADWKLQTALPRTFPLLPSSTTTKHLFVGNKEKCLNYSIAHQLVVMWRGWSIYLCSRLLPI